MDVQKLVSSLDDCYYSLYITSNFDILCTDEKLQFFRLRIARLEKIILKKLFRLFVDGEDVCKIFNYIAHDKDLSACLYSMIENKISRTEDRVIKKHYLSLMISDDR